VASKDSYFISGGSLEDVKRELSIILGRIGDRLDKIEGVRDKISPEFEDVAIGSLSIADENETVVHAINGTDS